MHGLVSLLPQPYFAQVKALWDELEQDFGLTGIRVTPYPHFSWLIAEDFDWEKLETTLQQVAAETPLFVAHTTGLALFTGERPVIYIPVVKTPQLAELHTEIWTRTAPASFGRSAYYAPEAWMPHVSLAYEDVSPDNVGRVMERLAFRSFNWEIGVESIALIYEPTGEIGSLKFKVPLG